MEKLFRVNNEVVVIEQGQEHLIQAGWVEITAEEAYIMLNPKKSFLELKADKLEQLAKNFESKTLRPRVEVISLGYFVDGSRTDLDNFKNGRDLLYPFIKDADNVPHPATISDYDAVIRAIQENGAELIGWNWAKKSEINQITIDENTTEAQAIAALEAVVIV